MRTYTEAYQYDPVGNFLSLGHTSVGGTWSRSYAYDEPNVPPSNNRLTSTTVGGTKEQPYLYDAHGNMTPNAASLADGVGFQGSVAGDATARFERPSGDDLLRL